MSDHTPATVSKPDAHDGAGHDDEQAPGNGETVLEARHMVKVFRTGRRQSLLRGRETLRAVDDVSLRLRRGEVTALVGQSGSGKSTMGQLLAQLMSPTSGEILLYGKPIKATRGRAFITYTGSVQMTLQDPFASLNPLHRVSYTLGRALRVHHKARGRATVEQGSRDLLDRVGLQPAHRYLHRFPHELSGGERQRVCFARALAAEPRVLLADEPVSMLDVTIRKEMLDLLDDLRQRENLAVLYITHDLGSAYAYSSETLVMHHGKVVERGPSAAVIGDPQVDYTKRLLGAAPSPQRRVTG